MRRNHTDRNGTLRDATLAPVRSLALATVLLLTAAACASGSDEIATDSTPVTRGGNATTSTVAPTSTTIDCEAHRDHDELAYRDCIDNGPHHAEPQTPRPAAGGDDHHHGECTTPPTDAERTAADDLIAAVMAEAPRFATEQQASEAGYVVIAPPFLGHGAHWVNPSYFNDGAIVDPAKPESLVYLDGELEGFMFLMDDTDDVGPRPGGCLTEWHGHDNLCMTAPIQEGGMVVFLTDFGPCPGDTELHIPPPMLHVWVMENPEGPFAGLET